MKKEILEGSFILDKVRNCFVHLGFICELIFACKNVYTFPTFYLGTRV